MLYVKLFANISGTGGQKVIQGNFIPNTTIVYAHEVLFIIDPGCTHHNLKLIMKNIEQLTREISERKLPLHTICISNTHSHPDHSANNNQAIQNITKLMLKNYGEKAPRVVLALTPQIKAYLEKYKTLLLDTLNYIFDVFNRKDTLHRLGYSALESFLVELITKFAEPTAKQIALLNFMQYYGSVKPAANQAVVLDARFTGVQIIPTPGHTDDSVSFFFPQQSLLCVGDLTWYLNPNNQLGDLDSLQASVLALIAFVDKNKVQTLVQGHGPEIHGAPAIIERLSTYLNRQELLYLQVSHIICKQPCWDFGVLANHIYNDSGLGQELRAISYTKTPSFPDFFILAALKRLKYSYDTDRKIFSLNIKPAD